MCQHNFQKLNSKLNNDDFVSNPGIYPRICKGSFFIDEDHNDMTGNLRFTEDNKLRNMLCKRLKLPEKKSIEFFKAKACISEPVESCISSCYSKKGEPAVNLSRWKKEVFKQVKEKITN